MFTFGRPSHISPRDGRAFSSLAAIGGGLPIVVNFIISAPREKTDLNVKMIQGDFSVASLNGWIEATIEEGNIEAKDLAGYFSALTKLGDLQIELLGKRWNGYGLTGATRRGSIRVILPADYSAALQMETKDGRIQLDYPDQIVNGESVPLTIAVKNKARSVSAPIGAGGAPVRLSTLSGDITLISAK
jgi:DUF4097 and DUF4098 domain-containing protein YvlB